jgi:RHS repeat-associated protein
VLEEYTALNSQPLTLNRLYTYGTDLISQNQWTGSAWTLNFYGYDGHGSVRYLTATNAAVTDTYDYDAFGTLIAQSGITPNNYLYCGEQFDADLGLYYSRARYLNADSDRFWTMDESEGSQADPLALHKYLYAQSDPVNGVDRTGNETLFESLGTMFIDQINLRSEDVKELKRARKIAGQLCHISAIIVKPFNAIYRQLKKLTAGSFFQAHHVVQDAEMLKMLFDGYTSGLGFAVPLLGGSKWPGSPHDMANRYQNDHKGEPLYDVAFGALQAAGCEKKDAASIVEAAKDYNEIKGWIIE